MFFKSVDDQIPNSFSARDADRAGWDILLQPPTLQDHQGPIGRPGQAPVCLQHARWHPKCQPWYEANKDIFRLAMERRYAYEYKITWSHAWFLLWLLD